MEQKIIEFIRLSAAESVGDAGFSSPYISIRTGGLTRVKCVNKLAKYISQLFISVITLMGF